MMTLILLMLLLLMLQMLLMMMLMLWEMASHFSKCQVTQATAFIYAPASRHIHPVLLFVSLVHPVQCRFQGPSNFICSGSSFACTLLPVEVYCQFRHAQPRKSCFSFHLQWWRAKFEFDCLFSPPFARSCKKEETKRRGRKSASRFVLRLLEWGDLEIEDTEGEEKKNTLPLMQLIFHWIPFFSSFHSRSKSICNSGGGEYKSI